MILIQKIYLPVAFLKLKSVFCNIGFSNFKIKDYFEMKCSKFLLIFVGIRIFNHSQVHNNYYHKIF